MVLMKEDAEGVELRVRSDEEPPLCPFECNDFIRICACHDEHAHPGLPRSLKS
jgi:hypothetical protein